MYIYTDYKHYDSNYSIIVVSSQGISGPSSVYVNVICERKHTADPVSRIFSIIITIIDKKKKIKKTMCVF